MIAVSAWARHRRRPTSLAPHHFPTTRRHGMLAGAAIRGDTPTNSRLHSPVRVDCLSASHLRPCQGGDRRWHRPRRPSPDQPVLRAFRQTDPAGLLLSVAFRGAQLKTLTGVTAGRPMCPDLVHLVRGWEPDRLDRSSALLEGEAGVFALLLGFSHRLRHCFCANPCGKWRRGRTSTLWRFWRAIDVVPSACARRHGPRSLAADDWLRPLGGTPSIATR